MWTFCVEGLRIAIESGQVAFPANDLLFNSAIILTPEKLNGATKTIGGVLHVQPLYEQEQGESFGSPSLGLYVRRAITGPITGVYRGHGTPDEKNCNMPQTGYGHKEIPREHII